MELERVAASAAHWTELQYRSLFSPTGNAVKNLVLVADDAGEGAPPACLGFLAARQMSLEWELENVVVSSASRRRGIGRRLLKALLDAARQTDSASVYLEVRQSNAAARALYEQAGFVLSGRRKSYYKDPQEDAILYRLDLR